MTGVVYSVRNCEMIRPPTMAMPRGWRSSAPAPCATARGKAPSSAAMVVIMIGRKRSRQACRIDCSGDMPDERSASRAKSIMMIAFFFTMPISRMMPISEIRSSSRPSRKSAASEPRPADGRVERMVIGWMKLS